MQRSKWAVVLMRADGRSALLIVSCLNRPFDETSKNQYIRAHSMSQWKQHRTRKQRPPTHRHKPQLKWDNNKYSNKQPKQHKHKTSTFMHAHTHTHTRTQTQTHTNRIRARTQHRHHTKFNPNYSFLFSSPFHQSINRSINQSHFSII